MLSGEFQNTTRVRSGHKTLRYSWYFFDHFARVREAKHVPKLLSGKEMHHRQAV